MKFVAQIITGSILASLLIFGANAWLASSREKEPASNWMEVKLLTVQPHVAGEDPKMLMYRILRKRFTARWIAEIHEQQLQSDGYSTVCWGSGLSDYDPAKVLPEPLHLSWFMGKMCELSAGTFRLCGTWIIQPANYPEKIIRTCSPPFEVSER